LLLWVYDCILFGAIIQLVFLWNSYLLHHMTFTAHVIFFLFFFHMITHFKGCDQLSNANNIKMQQQKSFNWVLEFECVLYPNGVYYMSLCA